MRNSKGVSAIMEQVFIMAFGVLVLITVVVTFSQLKDDSIEYSSGEQFEAVAQQVHSTIVLASQSMSTAGDGYLNVPIPEKVAGDHYIVRVNSTHIRVENFERTVNSTVLLSGINATISGNLSSDDSGKLRVYFNTTDNVINFTRV